MAKAKDQKVYALIYYQNGKRGWSQHYDKEDAESEAGIYRSQGAQILGVFEIDEPHDFAPLYIEGHDNHRFGEVIVDPDFIKNNADKPDDEFCVASVGGFEVTVYNLHQISSWCLQVLEFIRKHGYKNT